MRIKMNNIDVRDYGAVGDGVTDNSPAFDAALLAMQNAGSSRGNKLIIPNGTFRLSHELFIECNCIIEGSGVGQESSGTLLLFSPLVVPSIKSGNHGIVITAGRGSSTGRNAAWTIIRDLTIQAENMELPNRHGIIMRTRAKIENVNILGFTGNGIHIVTGDGNNSDGRTIWKPDTQYSVGDYVMEPGFPRHLLTSLNGSISATFNPQQSANVTNIYTLKITRKNADWDNTPIIGDTFIIPEDSVLAGSVLVGDPPKTEKPNAGAYIVLGPPHENVPAPTSTSFWAEKYADDPFFPSNGIIQNPVSVRAVNIQSVNDGQIFTRPQNRYGATTSGKSSVLGEGPGEVRLRFHSKPIGTFNGRVVGSTSGAEATILSEVLDIGSTSSGYLVITNSTRAFLNSELLNFGSTVANGIQYHSVGINLYDDHGATSEARWTQATPSLPHDMGNANNWMVEYCRVAGCGGHGMFLDGDNVNAGTSINFDASGTKGWGIYDNSFLGNTHIGSHTESNALGPYRTANIGSAYNVFIGCYSEGDSPPSKIYNPSLSIGGIMAAGFANDSSGFRLDATWEGAQMSSHFVKKFYNGKAIKTTIGIASESAQNFAGIEFSHTDDPRGFLMGGYNHESDSWTFGKTNYRASFEVLGREYSNVFRASNGLVIPAGPGTQGGGLFPGVFIVATNGYPLLGNLGNNSFCPGTLILNQNAANDGKKGWICMSKCGSGIPWTPWSPEKDPYYPGATITPSTPNGFVYRSTLDGPANGGDSEPAWPIPPQRLGTKVPDGNMIWELFGSTDKGLEEIITQEAITTPVITLGTNITSGEDRDITDQPFQRFGLIKIMSGNTGVKFSIIRPINSAVTYYVQGTVQTYGSKLTSVIANAQDNPDNFSNIIITIIGNSKATVNTDVAWLLKWS
jgi:Pectate lyase superfamily protein